MSGGAVLGAVEALSGVCARRPPCLVPAESALWLSEDEGERAVAAARCGQCDLVAQCCADAVSWSVSWGVWGGVDFSGKAGARELALRARGAA